MLRLSASKLGEGAIRGRRARVSLGCPRCGAACALETNTDGACPACKLSIRVEVDEPRCSCGFLLYGLDSPACPECGAMIPEALRWRAAALTPSQASTPPSP
jgi:rubrerythrin